jgi:hypothetical protein
MRFKELRKKLREAFQTVPTVTAGYKVGPMDGDNAVDFNANLGDLSEKNLDKINAFVGALCAKPYMDPDAALAQLQQKLSTIGLVFNYKMGQGSFQGKMSFPISYLGGSYGTDVYTYSPDFDDGISRRYGYGLALSVNSMKLDNGLTQLYAKVMKTAPKSPSNPEVPAGVQTPLQIPPVPKK